MRRCRAQLLQAISSESELGVVEQSPGVKGRHLRSDANDLHMRDTPQGIEDLDQPARAHGQGVTAGKQHVGDLGIVGNVLQSLGEIVRHLVVFVHEKTFAKAIPAV